MNTKVANAVERLNRIEIARLVSNIHGSIQWPAKEANNREIFSLTDDVDFATEFFLPLMTYKAA